MTTKKVRRDWRPAFLEALKLTGNVSASARAAGVNEKTPHNARHKDSQAAREFSQQWDDSLEIATDALELEARRRALDGAEEPVYYRGEVVGQIQRYSDTLMIFLLKAHRPGKFRENVSVEHSGQLTVRTLADVAREISEEPANDAEGQNA